MRPLADWESDVNPLAADTKLRMELLSVGPFCMINSNDPEMGEDDQPVLDHLGNTVYKQIPHYCSPNATRTQRSGVTDVEYMIRPDREYCEFKFARQRLAGESGDDIEMCRANLTARIAKCHLNCDACSAWCTSKAVREIASVAKCTIALPIMGMLQALHSSDLGTDIGYRWGAVRHSNRPANPTYSWEEKYRTLVQNSVSNPMGPRNCKLRTQTLTPCTLLHCLVATRLLALRMTCLLPARSSFVPEAAPRVERRLLPPTARRGRRGGGAQGLPRALQHRPGLLQPLRKCVAIRTPHTAPCNLSWRACLSQLIPCRACTTCARPT